MAPPPLSPFLLPPQLAYLLHSCFLNYSPSTHWCPRNAIKAQHNIHNTFVFYKILWNCLRNFPGESYLRISFWELPGIAEYFRASPATRFQICESAKCDGISYRGPVWPRQTDWTVDTPTNCSPPVTCFIRNQQLQTALSILAQMVWHCNKLWNVYHCTDTTIVYFLQYTSALLSQYLLIFFYSGKSK